VKGYSFHDIDAFAYLDFAAENETASFASFDERLVAAAEGRNVAIRRDRTPAAIAVAPNHSHTTVCGDHAVDGHGFG
jgi:hypothetical protein